MSDDNDLDQIRQAGEMADDTSKFIEILQQHLLACGDDLTLLSLRGHLIAEYLLETILLRTLGIPEAPKRSGKNKKIVRIMPGFYEKLKLVEAMVYQRRPGPNADLLLVVENLNDLRNHLAHNLKNQAEVESDVKWLVEDFHKRNGTKPDWKQGLPAFLKDCLFRLCQFLYAVRVHFYNEARKQADRHCC